MLSIIKKVFSEPLIKIKYSRPLKKFVVTHKYQGIIFVGDKSRCEWYVQNHKLA